MNLGGIFFIKKIKLKFYFQISNVAKVMILQTDPNLAKFGYKIGR
jgi:hypothetical protein